MAHRLRLETFRAVIGVIPEDRMRSTPEASADTLWAVPAPKCPFVPARPGWNWDEIRSWLSRMLVDVLLVSQPSGAG